MNDGIAASDAAACELTSTHEIACRESAAGSGGAAVEQLEGEHVLLLHESPEGIQPVIEAHQAFEEFARVAAELYEVMAAGAAHIKDNREGLVISDDALRDEYNRRVDEVNGARDALEGAIQTLTPDQRQSFARMGLQLYAK